MLNNKGQTLVLFVILVPIIIGMLALSYDVSKVYLEKNKIDNNIIMISDYYFNDYNDIETLINNNLKPTQLNINDNNIDITINKNVKGIFTSMYDINMFNIEISYTLDKENKKIIRK